MAGASTSQKIVVSPGRSSAATSASSSSSKTPTPLALTTTSALRACSTSRLGSSGSVPE
ncbi:hypothetical protein WME79_36725 [Sorangium sp. So ce726]